MLTEQRANQLLNNLLCEISERIEWDSEAQYLAWLVNEIGFSAEEINSLREKELLPLPVINSRGLG